MKRGLILLVISLAAHFASGQQAISDSATELKPRQLAFYYARHLRSGGALLVRLQERARGIEILRKMGDTLSANQIIKQQRLQNKTIMDGFRKSFHYSPVYFFYNTNNDSVLAGHMQGVFLDTNLVANPAIKLKESFFLVAEEGDVEIADFDDNSQGATHAGRTGGVLVMDSKFNLLPSPFPYFTDYGSFKNFWKAVAKLDEKLNDIYPYKQE